MVMYLGHVVEIGTTDQVFSPPYHPYTEALLVGRPHRRHRVEKTHIVLEGEIPSAMNPPPGCPFQTRCPRKAQVPPATGLSPPASSARTEVPPLRTRRRRPPVQVPPPREVLASMQPVIRIAAE
jgi:peptide/nickel transport system ATP-binding protein